MQTLKNLLDNSKLFRIVTDIVIGAFALFGAFMFRFFVQLSTGSDESGMAQLFNKYGSDYLRCLPIVLTVCLGTYYSFGFYNKGRYYTGRYKLICVLQAVSVAYLIIGLAAFMTQGALIPRSVLPLAWLITTVITALSRIWTLVWRKIVLEEEVAIKRKPGYKLHNVLVIGADVFSKITDWTRRDAVFFGDGAGAILLQPSDNKDGLFSSLLFSTSQCWRAC